METAPQPFNSRHCGNGNPDLPLAPKAGLVGRLRARRARKPRRVSIAMAGTVTTEAEISGANGCDAEGVVEHSKVYVLLPIFEAPTNSDSTASGPEIEKCSIAQRVYRVALCMHGCYCAQEPGLDCTSHDKDGSRMRAVVDHRQVLRSGRRGEASHPQISPSFS